MRQKTIYSFCWGRSCSVLSFRPVVRPVVKKEALLAYALDHARNNRTQWIAVLDHYAADSLKSEATS